MTSTPHASLSPETEVHALAAPEGPPPPSGPGTEPPRARRGARSLAPALAGAAALALLEEAVSATRGEGLRWLPRTVVPAPGWAGGHLPAGVALAVAAATVLAVAGTARAVRLALARYGSANVATAAAAGMASAVSASGMWVFFGTWVHETAPVKVIVFAFLEVATLAVALRARDNMRDLGASGVDGLLVWALTGVSALLSSTAATSPPEALLRLLVPLVAGVLWERALVSERRRRERDGLGSAEPWWRRALVRAGLADPQGRSAGETETARRLTAVALAGHRYAREAARQQDGWRARRAERAADAAMRAAVQRTGLATDERLQQAVAAQVRMLGSVRELAAAAAASPWTWLPPAGGAGAGADSGPGELGELAGELAAAQRDGDHARLRRLLAGRDDHADLARWVVTTGGAKRLLAAIALHADPDHLGSQAAAQDWVAATTGQDSYLPDRSEIRRTRKLLFPELETSGARPVSQLEVA